MTFHNKVDSVEANCLLASIKHFILTETVTSRLCMLSVWLHFRDDLELQSSVDICVMLLSF